MVSVIEGFHCTYIQGWIQRLKREGTEWRLVGVNIARTDTLGGPGDMLPQKIFRRYARASEAIEDHHNHTKFVASRV